MKSKSIAFVTATVLGSLSQFAPAASEVDTLRQRCAEQERQIKELEKEVDSLHSLIERDNRTANAGTLSVASSTQTSAGATYTVRSGDTMSKIAKQNSLSLGALLKANSSVDPSKMRVGQKLVIPGSSSVAAQAPAPAPAAKPTPSVANPSSYTVKSGDTVYSISRAHGVSPQQLIDHNGKLNPNSLRVGQKIAIPSGSKNTSVAAKAPQPAVAKQPAAQPKPQPQAAPQPKPQPAVAKAPAPAPQREEVKQVSHQPSQPKVRTVTVTKQMTFGDFANQHGADITQINELNGLSLTKSTVLAQGSELYVPGQQH